MRFENADVTDISQLTDLRIAYLEEDNGGLNETDRTLLRDRLSDYFKRNLGESIFVYVARNEKMLVACAFLLIVEKPCSPAFPTGRTGIVLNVYTRPGYRRRGYAKKLMEMLLADAEKKKVSPVELKATDAGYPLYRTLGFRDAGSKYHLMKWSED